ncbi:MAG: Hpt domain-containing protein, partial [Campylobacterota bacterium]
AAAMQEDRDRAQKAGMDGHVAKPIDRHELYSALTKLTGVTSSTQSAPANAASTGTDTVLDIGHLQENIGSKEAAHRLLQKFKTQLIEGEFAAVDEALRQNSKDAHELIHSLKGLSGNVGAHRLYQAALQIDTLYKEGKTPLEADRNHLLKQKYKLIEKLDKIEDNDNDKQAEQAVSQQESKALFEKIENQLRENELIDQADLDALHAGIKDTVSQQEWQRFESLATDFEFEQALELMRGWNI